MVVTILRIINVICWIMLIISVLGLIISHYTKSVKLKIQPELNCSLSLAVTYGDKEEVLDLLDRGADPFSIKTYILIHAAKSGYYDTLKLVLDSQKSKIDKRVQEN